jgi:N-acetylglucosamine-6-sulfatase
VPSYHGLRTRDALYVEYATGERELYDLARDPAQLENAIGSADAARLAALAGRVTALRSCAGARCRALEDEPLP